MLLSSSPGMQHGYAISTPEMLYQQQRQHASMGLRNQGLASVPGSGTSLARAGSSSAISGTMSGAVLMQGRAAQTGVIPHGSLPACGPNAGLVSDSALPAAYSALGQSELNAAVGAGGGVESRLPMVSGHRHGLSLNGCAIGGPSGGQALATLDDAYGGAADIGVEFANENFGFDIDSLLVNDGDK
jgi:hypothetical protein